MDVLCSFCCETLTCDAIIIHAKLMLAYVFILTVCILFELWIRDDFIMRRLMSSWAYLRWRGATPVFSKCYYSLTFVLSYNLFCLSIVIRLLL